MFQLDQLQITTVDTNDYFFIGNMKCDKLF